MLSRLISSDEDLFERGMGLLLLPLLAAVGEQATYERMMLD